MASGDFHVTLRADDRVSPVLRRIGRRLWWMQYGALVTVGLVHQGKKKGPTAWVRKAIAEHRKGKTVVLVYPIDKWVLMLLDVIGAEVRNLGDVRWLATEDRSVGAGTGRHIACFVLRGQSA